MKPDQVLTLAQIREMVRKLNAAAMRPRPATAKECRRHNALMRWRGRPDLCIAPGTPVYTLRAGAVVDD